MSEIITTIGICFLLFLAYTHITKTVVNNLVSHGQEKLAEMATQQSKRFTALSQAVELVEYYSESRYEAMLKLLDERITICSIANFKEQDRLFNRLYSEVKMIAQNHTDLAATESYRKLVRIAEEYNNDSANIQREYNIIANKLNKMIALKPNKMIANFADMRKMTCY